MIESDRMLKDKEEHVFYDRRMKIDVTNRGTQLMITAVAYVRISSGKQEASP